MTTDKTTTEEAPKTIKIMVEGREVEVAADSRIYTMIKNAEEEQRQALYKGQRETFLEAASKVIYPQMDGFENAIEGMTLIYDCDKDEIKLARSPLVKVTIRELRKEK